MWLTSEKSQLNSNQNSKLGRSYLKVMCGITLGQSRQNLHCKWHLQSIWLVCYNINVDEKNIIRN